MRSDLHKALGVVAVVVAVVFGGGVLTRSAPQREPVAGAEVKGAQYRLLAADARADHARTLDPGVVARGFTYAAGTDALSRQAIVTAVASARPEAQRLIALVDGLVTIRVGPTGVARSIGLTQSGGAGYAVTLDLGPVFERYGQRGVTRVVLHELGHVVDHAIVPSALDERLDAGVPQGYGCEQGVSGACATRDERFAESFAKWAMNDIGLDLDLGYKVMPPEPTLSIWGEPLARLAA